MLDIEEKGFKVELTLVDTPGFGDGIDRQAAHAPIIQFLDDQHESYLRQESQPGRKIYAPAGSVDAVMDMRVHACLYFIPPHCHTLRPLDIEAMKALSSRVNLIPVIAKADTLSKSRLAALKEQVRKMISLHDIQVYTCPLESDDEETSQRNIDVMSSMPFAIISSDGEVTLPDGRRILGRVYPWGVAEGMFL
jgi:cell division control protein 12